MPVNPDVPRAAGNFSRRTLLVAGTATALSLQFQNSESEVSGAADSALKSDYFPGFSSQMIETNGTSIHVLTRGSGPPLLLLHGYPEMHLTWHKVAPQLAEHFSVVVPDLRGYGDSGKPPGGDRHENYSFRAMAQDQVDVMRHYGHERFLVAAHDRGARVTHRLCLDHPESVERACLMDIAPTLTMYEGTNQEFATRYMWWFFLIQASPLPEHMIGCDPKFYLERVFASLNRTPGAITSDEMSVYTRDFSNPAEIHATCEDFRAAAGIDLDMDKADDAAGRKIQCPLHVLWGAKGTVGVLWDILATWRAKCAATVTGRSLDCGHFLQEERPQEVLGELRQFLRPESSHA
jgi:haloacetate dehalogenase